MTDKPTPTDAAPPCDQELFDQGVSVGLFDIPKWTAEALCKGIAAATGARVDWHYIGGRVHIKALPAARAPADNAKEDAAREAIEKVLALFPFNVPTQKFTVNNGPCLTADNDDEFYSVKRVLAFLTEIKTTLDAASKQASKEQAMTDKPTPTDAELIAVAGEPFGYFHQLLNHEGKGNGVWLGAAERKVVEQAHTPGETSEEIVALYTTPQPTQAQAAEPVAWAFKYDDGTWHDPSTTEHSPGMRPLCAAPQPVARVPLDEARRLFDAGWKAAALFCDREDVVADGIIGFGACPQFEAAFSAAHGSKGGQHG